MTQTNYKYFAFISYNSKDVEWGKRIQRKLEHYRMPATLCSERGWKRTPINPVFFAPTDIQPRELTEEIKQRLRDSKHLIVVCSPNSAKSEWVGKEIAYFHELGRTENIHFFIVDGIPNSGDVNTECFNPIIKELGLKEKLGANIHEKIYKWKYLNKERAYTQLISVLLDVEFDSLWRRHRRQLINKLLMITLITAIIITAFFIVWQKNQPIDISINLKETTEANDNLPPLVNAVVSLQLENETKTDTLKYISSKGLFANVPQKYIGKKVNIRFKCENYLPIDTTLTLSHNVSLNISRNPEIYGNVKITLWDQNKEQPATGVELSICGINTTTDENGVAQFSIPLNLQDSSYVVKSSLPLQDDTILMPCGESTYLFIKN